MAQVKKQGIANIPEGSWYASQLPPHPCKCPHPASKGSYCHFLCFRCAAIYISPTEQFSLPVLNFFIFHLILILLNGI